MQTENFDQEQRFEHAKRLVLNRFTEHESGSPLLNAIRRADGEDVETSQVYSTRDFENLNEFLDDVLRRDCLSRQRQSVAEQIRIDLNLSSHDVRERLGSLSKDQLTQIAHILAESSAPLQWGTFSEKNGVAKDPDRSLEILARGNIAGQFPLEMPLEWIREDLVLRRGVASEPEVEITIDVQGSSLRLRIDFEDQSNNRYIQNALFSMRDADGRKLAESRLDETGNAIFPMPTKKGSVYFDVESFE